MQKLCPTNSRVSNMRNTSISDWKQETIKIDREKRGLSTMLISLKSLNLAREKTPKPFLDNNPTALPQIVWK